MARLPRRSAADYFSEKRSGAEGVEASPSPFAPPLVNTNATALEDNRHAIQAAHDDYFFRVCKP
jgi:hypothetical protein